MAAPPPLAPYFQSRPTATSPHRPERHVSEAERAALADSREHHWLQDQRELLRRSNTRAIALLGIGLAAAVASILFGACGGPRFIAAPASAPTTGDQIVAGAVAAKVDARADATVGGIVSRRQQSQRVEGDGNTTGLPVSGREFTAIIIAAIAAPLLAVAVIVIWAIRRWGYEKGKQRWLRSKCHDRHGSETSSRA